MRIIKQIGDVFTADKKYTLVHCISFDAKMKKGIAKRFNVEFPQMKKEILDTIINNNLKYEPMSIMYIGDDRNVINLITKPVYYTKPSYISMSKALKQAYDLCKQNNIKFLAMPKIGCGLDKLNWEFVEEQITNIFGDSDITIKVYSL